MNKRGEGQGWRHPARPCPPSIAKSVPPALSTRKAGLGIAWVEAHCPRCPDGSSPDRAQVSAAPCILCVSPWVFLNPSKSPGEHLVSPFPPAGCIAPTHPTSCLSEWHPHVSIHQPESWVVLMPDGRGCVPAPWSWALTGLAQHPASLALPPKPHGCHGSSESHIRSWHLSLPIAPGEAQPLAVAPWPFVI